MACVLCLTVVPPHLPTHRGIIAEVRSGDSRLKDAVGKNDFSLLSSDGVKLLRTTLNNWGHTIRTLGSTDPADDSDDSDSSSSSSSGNGDKSAGGGGDSSSGKQQEEKCDAAQEEKEEEEATRDELQVKGTKGRAVPRVRLCVATGCVRFQKLLVIPGQRTIQTLAACALFMLCHAMPRHAVLCRAVLCRAVCCTPQVRFLDVASAITALARTAGEQLTVNLKKWSPAGGFGSPHAQHSTAQRTSTRAVTADPHVLVLVRRTLTVHARFFSMLHKALQVNSAKDMPSKPHAGSPCASLRACLPAHSPCTCD